jgi:hypothetical protein
MMMVLQQTQAIRTAVIAFAVLALFCIYFSAGAATNVLRGDDWRFLLIFYKKWLEGTLELKDLFSDYHQVLFYPLFHIANAELFSLQGKTGTWLGLVIKILTGGLLLRQFFLHETAFKSGKLAILFPLYIVFLFFGLNEFEEYTWPLVTYGSNMTQLCGIVLLICLDRLMLQGPVRFSQMALFTGLCAFFLVLLGTSIKLFLLAIILALGAVMLVERQLNWNRIAPVIIMLAVLAIYTAFIKSLNLPEVRTYNLSLSSMAELAAHWRQTFFYLAYGAAAGITMARILPYPSLTLDIIAVFAFILVLYSVVLYYRERMWNITLLPIVFTGYMLLTFLGALVFRKAEINPDTWWPLYMPRYFPVYHMGWIGVVWIYYYKAKVVVGNKKELAIAVLLELGICFMLLGIAKAWHAMPLLEERYRKAEIALCKYASGEARALNEIELPIRGHFFSEEAVLLLKARKLSIFSDESKSYRCEV